MMPGYKPLTEEERRWRSVLAAKLAERIRIEHPGWTWMKISNRARRQARLPTGEID